MNRDRIAEEEHMGVARVYIWYPHGTHIGHCSMHIGPERGPATLDRYVSWWPAQPAGLTDVRAPRARTYAQDYVSEGGFFPHVYYDLTDVNEEAMLAEWDAI